MTTPDRLAERLEPCPFCGSEAEWNLGKKGDDTPWRYLACSECEAMGPCVRDSELSATDDAYNDSVLIEAWNRRALATPVPGTVSNAMVERAWDRLFPGNLTVISITKADLTTALEAAVQSPPIVGVRALHEAISDFVLEHVAIAGKSANDITDEILANARILSSLAPVEAVATGGDTHSASVTTTDGRVLAYNKQTRTIDTLKSPPVEAVATEPVGLHIVFDGPPSHESGRFVEVETPDGKSINAGEWHERLDGLWELRLVHPTGDSGALREALDGLNLLLGQAIHHLRNHDIYTHKTYADLANELQVWAKEHRAALSKGEPGK